jgi:hypothetical protein
MPSVEDNSTRFVVCPAMHSKPSRVSSFEAINDLFQAVKRKARGYGNFSTIRTVVFLLASKLDFTNINPHAA